MKIVATRLLSAFGAALLAISGGAWAQAPAANYQEGVHYTTIPDAPARADGPVEVVEVFSYLCTHCNTFEPYVNSWKTRKPDNVSFARAHAVFGRSAWELYARAYVTAELMGIADEAHGPLMDKIWKEREVMRDMDEIAAFYADFGAAPDEFVAMSKSFAVDAKMRRDQRAMQSANVRGTPSVIVDGKYLVAASAAVANYDILLDVVDHLIAIEAAAAAAPAAAE